MIARILFLVGLPLLLLTGCNTAGEQDAQIVAVPVNTASALAQVNAYRAQHGEPRLRNDPRLNAAAADMAQLMARTNRSRPPSHNSRGITRRFHDNQIDAYIGSEFIATGHESFNHVFGQMRRSTGANRSVLNPDMTRIGFARAQRMRGHTPRDFWVVTLARTVEDGEPGS